MESGTARTRRRYQRLFEISQAIHATVFGWNAADTIAQGTAKPSAPALMDWPRVILQCKIAVFAGLLLYVLVGH